MVAALSVPGRTAAARLQPAEQVRLLRLVVLGRDRASVAQVGQVGERPRDLVGIGSGGRASERGATGAGCGGGTTSGSRVSATSIVLVGRDRFRRGGPATSRIGGPGARNEPDMSCSYSCLASIIAFLKPMGLTIIRKRSMPASDAVRTSRSPKPRIRPKIDWVRIASLIFSSELSVERLLTTPATSITRRLVSTYSWLR